MSIWICPSRWAQEDVPCAALEVVDICAVIQVELPAVGIAARQTDLGQDLLDRQFLIDALEQLGNVVEEPQVLLVDDAVHVHIGRRPVDRDHQQGQ